MTETLWRWTLLFVTIWAAVAIGQAYLRSYMGWL